MGDRHRPGYWKEWYETHRSEILPKQTDNSRKRKRYQKIYLIEYKGGKCQDCGGAFPPCCFQFDHRIPEEKSFGIGEKMGYSLEMLKAEADKCDLVCANCHAIRTAGDERLSEKISLGILNSKKEIVTQ